MSVSAIISNEIRTHIGSFTVNIAFADSVTGFAISDLTFMALSGNGLANIHRTLAGSGDFYTVNVSVPIGVFGSFSVGITGQVLVDGTAENVIAATKIFKYDTDFDVATTFDALQYDDMGKIILPVIFSENVISINKTDFSINKIIGSNPDSIDLILIGEDNNYEIIFQTNKGWGAIKLSPIGLLLKEEDLISEPIRVDPLLISYNNLPTTLADVDTPFLSEDGWWNVGLEFEYPVVGFGIHSIITGIEIQQSFIYRGLRLDSKPSEIPPVFSDDYTFASVQFQHCVGDWEYIDLKSTEQARYFWVKLNPAVTETKEPDILLKDENGLSPVSVRI